MTIKSQFKDPETGENVNLVEKLLKNVAQMRPLKSSIDTTVKKQAAEKAKTAADHAQYMQGKRRMDEDDVKAMGLKKGGYVKAADGCCKKGKTKGKII